MHFSFIHLFFLLLEQLKVHNKIQINEVFLKSGINLHCFGCFVIPRGVLGDTEEKRTTDRQRQTRAVTTIDRDTGEGRTEPRGGC